MGTNMEEGYAGPETLEQKIGKTISQFAAQLGTNKTGMLAQAWIPEPSDDGGVVLNTQGHPFCVNGAADLLALFRCISCKYKFTTDTTKPWSMGPVGRVFVSGEPELTQSVQQYDQTVYLRVAEAQRCHVNCCMFLPVYASHARDRVAAVMEVVGTDENARFSGLADWAKVCLQQAGLFTFEADSDSLPVGLRAIKTNFVASALESKVGARAGGVHTATGAASMPPPPPTGLAVAQQRQAPSITRSIGSDHAAGGAGTAAGLAAAEGPLQQQTLQQLQGAGHAAQATEDALDGSSVHTRRSLHVGAAPPAPGSAVAGGGFGIGGGGGQMREPAAAAGEVSGSAGWGSAAAGLPTKGKIIQLGNNLVFAPDALAANWAVQMGGGSGSGSGGSTVPAMQLPLPELHQQQHQLLQAPALWPAAAVATLAGAATTYGHGDRAISLDDLAPHFNMSLRDAAAKMGISVTTLKRACRRLGLQRWPRRDLASRAQELSAAVSAAAAATAAVAHHGPGGSGIFTFMSGQTISGDSSGDHARELALHRHHPHFPMGMPGMGGMVSSAPSQAQANPVRAMMPPALPSFFVPGTSLQGTGGDLQTHSLGSIDILAAGDIDTFSPSVGNSPLLRHGRKFQSTSSAGVSMQVPSHGGGRTQTSNGMGH